MISVTYDGDACLLTPHSFFKLSYGVRPSFGCFAMNVADVAAAVTAGTPGDLFLDDGVNTLTFYGIYPIKYISDSALSPATARIYLADGRVTWPFYYGAQDYNTYMLDRTLACDINVSDNGGTVDERDFELDCLNSSTEWTFAQIFTDIFENVLGLAGANYTLQLQAVGGAAPTRKPRNIHGKNIPVPEILHQLLEQANCFLAVDLLTDPPHYQVIPIGDADAWQATITYRVGEVSLDTNIPYYSIQNANLNKDPSSEPTWWTLPTIHQESAVDFNKKASRGATAKMRTSVPAFTNWGFYGEMGSEAVAGGTGKHLIPSPYEALYAGDVIKNSQFLTNMGNELAKEYEKSFQNSWHDIHFNGALPFSLGRSAQEITWELTEQKGFTTHIKSFRPREKPFPVRHTLFAYDQYWLGGGASAMKWAKITRSLMYADPENPIEELQAGVSEYWGRFLEAATPDAWAEGTVYEEDDEVLFNNHIYTKTDIEAGEQATQATKPSSNSSNNWWTIKEDAVLKGLAREGDGAFTPSLGDLRDYTPWFAVDDIVPVIERDGDYYIFQTVTPCGDDAHCSLRWNEESGRAMAVYK